LLMPPIDQTDQEAAEDVPFLAAFITPLLKASTKANRKTTLAFYSVAEYNAWRNTLEDGEIKKWSAKYYKGLGTSTPAEAKEYFSAFDSNLRPFRWKSSTDGVLLDMLFEKDRACDRRDWIIKNYDMTASIVVNPNEGNAVSYEDFVNKEILHYSNADNLRSIPSVMDGLKPSQRKVLYSCFKRKLTSEIKVAQLTGYW
jgi:DNA topoisomerase II